MIEVKNEQIYDLYIAGYRIFEIASIFKCSESTIKRKLREIKKIKKDEEIKSLALLGIDISEVEEKDISRSIKQKIICNKNEIIKLYLAGYTAKEIEFSEGYSRADIYNIIRHLKRTIGMDKFEGLYEKTHNKNREKLLKDRKKEKYNKDIEVLTGLEVRNYINDKSLFPFVSSAYTYKGNTLVLTKEAEEMATWDLPKKYSAK